MWKEKNILLLSLLCLIIVTLTSFLSSNFIWIYKSKYINIQNYKVILADYQNLQNNLKSEKFDDANLNTDSIIRYLANTGKYGAINIEYVPCNHLINLNKYWSIYSKDKFSFSVQKKTWNNNKNVNEFVKALSWENSCQSTLNSKLVSLPDGHFPKCMFINTEKQVQNFMNKLEQCRI